MVSAIGSSTSDWVKQMWLQLTKKDSDGDGKLSKAELQTSLPNTTSATSTTSNFDKIFSLMDSNGDGKVSLDEFSKFEQSHKNKGSHKAKGTSIDDMQEKLWQSLLNQADTNQDSKVSKSEFETILTSASSTASAPVTSPEADTLFSRIDTNQDNQMSQDEFSTFMQANRPAPPPPPPPANPNSDSTGFSISDIQSSLWQSALEDTDTDKNNIISKAEFQKAVTSASSSSVSSSTADKLFAVIDSNKDGDISQNEFNSFSNILLQQLQAYMQNYSNSISSDNELKSSTSYSA